MKRFFQLMLPFYFSHHPLCNNYRQEVLKIGAWYICRGCFCVYVSTLFSLLMTVFVDPFNTYSLSEVFFIVLIVSSPTWIAFLFNFQNRIIKDLIRISLGLGWGIALGELWLQPSWSDKFVIFLLMFIFWFIFRKSRNFQTRRKTIIMCQNCVDLNNKACLGYSKQIEAERLYSREVSDFLQQKLNWDDIQKGLRKSPVSKIEGSL
ncbi:MAG: hypothetical protein ACFFAE_12210 [Candidatus Hodarchaeota archaeon]